MNRPSASYLCPVHGLHPLSARRVGRAGSLRHADQESGQTATESLHGRSQRKRTPPLPSGAERTDGSSVPIGALVPLSRPGWVEAGQHLLAGLELAAREVNEAGGIAGRPVELVVRDPAADPQRAAAAVDELARLGVAALAGEYHSVVARAAA